MSSTCLRETERAEARVVGGLRFGAAVVPAGRLPCAARCAGRLRQLGPGYRASDTSKSSRSTAPTPLRCAARRRTGAAPADHPRLCGVRHRASRASGTAVSRKAVGGRPAARLCGAEERRGAGVAHRPEAMRRAQPVRAPSTGSSRSEMPPVRGRVLRSPPRTEHRRAVAAQRRPPHRSADGRAPAALRARSHTRRLETHEPVSA